MGDFLATFLWGDMLEYATNIFIINQYGKVSISAKHTNSTGMQSNVLVMLASISSICK
jgi:hypothetical protein